MPNAGERSSSVTANRPSVAAPESMIAKLPGAVAGTGLRRRTSYGGGASTPKCHPTVGSSRMCTTVLSTLNADGGNKLRRFPGKAPSWSPDGLRLAYATTGETTDRDGNACRYNTLVMQFLSEPYPREIESFDAQKCWSAGRVGI